MVTWERKFCWPEEMGQGAKERWGNKPFSLPCHWRTVCSHHLISFTINCLCIFTPTLLWVPGGQYWTIFILISPDPGESLAPLGHHPSLKSPRENGGGGAVLSRSPHQAGAQWRRAKDGPASTSQLPGSSWSHLTSLSCEFSGHLSPSLQPHHILITILHTRLTFILRAVYTHGWFSS